MPELITDEPREERALDELANDAASRKRFLRMMGGGGAAAAAAAFLAACGSSNKNNNSGGNANTGGGAAAGTTSTAASGSGSGNSDLDIVNYALTLEYLEADFYDKVVGSGLVKDKKVLELAKHFGDSEHQHVDALMKTAQSLGKPADKPNANFDSVFSGGLTKVLETAATVENLGAAAYLGQAANIKNKDILAAALAIHSVEARHAAALNKLVGRGFKGSGQLEGSLPDGAFGKPMTMDEVLQQVKPFLA